MSDKIGPVSHAEQTDRYLGANNRSNPNSEETANIIDSEVKRLVEDGFKHAKEILEKHLNQLHSLAKALLEYETLTGEEIKDLLEGRGINRIKIEIEPKVRKSSFPKVGGFVEPLEGGAA